MEVARPFFRSPQPQHHLAELRIEVDQSPVAFSDPCVVGRKRRCLFPAFSPRKKMLLELPPFPSPPAPSPPGSTGRNYRVGSNGSFSFCAPPEQPLATAGSNGSGASALLAPHGRPLTSMGSTASCGSGILPSQSSLSPGPGGPTGNAGLALFASPKKPARSSTGVGDAWAFLASTHLASGRAASPGSATAKELAPVGNGVSDRGGLGASSPFALSASRTSASLVYNSDGSTLWSRRRRSQQLWEEQLQITLPLQNIAKTGVPLRRAVLPESSSKVSKQDARKTIHAVAGRLSPPAGKQDRGVQVSSMAGEGSTSPSPAARPCAGVVVRVTCSCGARREFCFDHCH